MFPAGDLQVVSWSPEPFGGRVSTDSVQGELLPGEEQPDLQERLLAVTQVGPHLVVVHLNMRIPHVSIKNHILPGPTVFHCFVVVLCLHT